MSIRIKQLASAILAATAIYVGLWAAAWPQQFYDSFPGFGRHWVAALGPYNEHLIRDVGGLYLAMAVISVWAAVVPRREIFPMVGLGWLAFNIPHCLFHFDHLDVYSAADIAGNVIALVGVVVLAALLMVPTGRDAARSTVS